MTRSSVVVQTNTSVAAAAVLRARVDLTAVSGGSILASIRNGATGPTAPCTLRLMIARNQASMPAAGAASTSDDGWKILYEVSGGIAALAVTPLFWIVPPEIAYAQLEWSGHAGQPIDAEAQANFFTDP